MTETTKPKTKGRRVRSPGYPSFDLQEALAKATVLYEKERRNAAPFDTVVQHWGYKGKSSSALKAVATLLKFGLVEASGAGRHRHIKVSPLGLRIILDKREGSAERGAAIREAALNPALYKKLWAEWGAALSSDSTIEYQLLQQLKFNDDVVRGVIRGYRTTVSFAKLGSDDIIKETEADGNGDPATDPLAPKPLKGKNGGSSVLAGTKQDVFTLEEGQAVLQWPSSLSADSYEDLKDWVTLALRKIKRSVGAKSEPSGKQDE